MGCHELLDESALLYDDNEMFRDRRFTRRACRDVDSDAPIKVRFTDVKDFDMPRAQRICLNRFFTTVAILPSHSRDEGMPNGPTSVTSIMAGGIR